MTTASVRLAAPSFWRMALTWSLTLSCRELGVESLYLNDDDLKDSELLLGK